jgi:predicted ArsR family transcriptional regulator
MNSHFAMRMLSFRPKEFGPMNQTLIDAIKEVEALPDAEQEELGRELLRLAARKRIDAVLAESEARGGGKPHAEFMDELLKDLRT